MAELCITSGIDLIKGDAPNDVFTLDDVKGVGVEFIRATGVKCARSWKYFDPSKANPNYPDITPRDAEAVMEWEKANGESV